MPALNDGQYLHGEGIMNDDQADQQQDRQQTEVSSNRRVRYAVVGLGFLSQAAVLPGFAHATPR